ncbi:MAG: PhnA domain-containing protein [Persicimonas sp.]
MTIDHELLSRADHKCELCQSPSQLRQYEVASESPRETSVVICGGCAPQLAEDAELDANHWHCLQGSIWSEHAPVKVLSWRLLHKLRGKSWALELLDQAYLTEEEMEWAREAVVEVSSDGPVTRDSNGRQLLDGDSVTLVRNLDVKGTSFVAKQGTRVKDIRLIDGDPDNIEGKVNGIMLVLKTEFLKKA